jgi:hypothetical protein
MNWSGCMNDDIGKYVRFRRLPFVTQLKNQSIKNDDRFPEKVLTLKR